MASLWTWGIDYQNQPLLDAWWTPGWTAQNDAYVQVPANQFSAAGFPTGLVYVNVAGSFFDTMANPISGYLTFWPSTALTITQGSNITYMPQRYAGTNTSSLGLNQMGDGKIYLQYGKLSVSLMATDNLNMLPATFTYHVREHTYKGNQYDIKVPLADASANPAVDIHSLIIPGSIRSVTDDTCTPPANRTQIPAISTQYLMASVSDVLPPGITFTPSNYPVNFAFISGAAEPTTGQWQAGSWATTVSPFIAQILVGPNAYNLAVGSYAVWVQIVATPQVPAFQVGYLDIF